MVATTAPYFDQDQKPARVPFWREYYGGLDWAALRAAPVFYGVGVPHGDGSAVIVIPGFLTTDLYLYEFRSWLKRVGYHPYMSRIGRNAECFSVLHERLKQTIDRAYAETGRKVHLVGHSLGGVLGLSAAVRWPDKVASVVTLGSPFRGIRSHPLALEAGELVRRQIERQPGCFTSTCSCAASRSMQRPPAATIPVTTIYTKTDGVVDWRYCRTDDPTNNFEVKGTHIGLAFNPAVYRLVGLHLAGKGKAGLIA